MRLGEVEGDVAARVAGSVKHVHLQVPELPGVALPQGDIDPRDTVLVGPGPHDGEPVLLLQLQVAAGVVVVVVSVQNIVRLEAPDSHINAWRHTTDLLVANSDCMRVAVGQVPLVVRMGAAMNG